MQAIIHTSTNIKNLSGEFTSDAPFQWQSQNSEMQYVVRYASAGTWAIIDRHWISTPLPIDRQVEVDLTNIHFEFGAKWVFWTVESPVEDEFTDTERSELRRRYKQSKEHPMTLAHARSMPNLLDSDFG